MSADLTTREAFLESVLHDEHSIMGRNMLPFCLEMWCILDALKSPLIVGGKASIADLQMAVIACSTESMKDFYRLTRNPSLRQQIWFYVTRGNLVSTILKQFNAYIEDYVPLFPSWENTEGGYTPEFKCPEIFLCAARLMDRGHSKREVHREMALGEIMAWKLAMDEAKGDPLDHIRSDETTAKLKEAGLL